MLAIQAGEFVWCGVFSTCLRHGNPAFVIRLQSWPDDSELGFIAAFMGHVEVAFVILENNNLQIRWFAGAHEVPLCGHAALAANAVFLSQKKWGTAPGTEHPRKIVAIKTRRRTVPAVSKTAHHRGAQQRFFDWPPQSPGLRCRTGLPRYR